MLSKHSLSDYIRSGRQNQDAPMCCHVTQVASELNRSQKEAARPQSRKIPVPIPPFMHPNAHPSGWDQVESERSTSCQVHSQQHWTHIHINKYQSSSRVTASAPQKKITRRISIVACMEKMYLLGLPRCHGSVGTAHPRNSPKSWQRNVHTWESQPWGRGRLIVNKQHQTLTDALSPGK